MKENKNLSLKYIIAMPIIFIITTFFSNIHIEILGSPLYFLVVLFEVLFLISGLIIRKSNYKDAITTMGISLTSAALSFIVQWAMLDIMNAYLMIYSFLSFLICQLTFIYVYDFLIKIKKDTYMPVLILLLIVSAIDSAFFGVIIEGQYISVSILLRLMSAIIIAVFLAQNKSKK